MKIRTVFQPDVELEVDAAEAETLRLQGLIHTPAARPREPQPPTPAKTSPAAVQAPAAKSDTPTIEGAEQGPTTQKG